MDGREPHLGPQDSTENTAPPQPQPQPLPQQQQQHPVLGSSVDDIGSLGAVRHGGVRQGCGGVEVEADREALQQLLQRERERTEAVQAEKAVLQQQLEQERVRAEAAEARAAAAEELLRAAAAGGGGRCGAGCSGAAVVAGAAAAAAANSGCSRVMCRDSNACLEDRIGEARGVPCWQLPVVRFATGVETAIYVVAEKTL